MTEEKKHEEHTNHEHSKHEHTTHKHAEHHVTKKNDAYKVSTWILVGISFLLLVGLILALTLGAKSEVKSESMSDVKTSVETYLKSISDNQASVDDISDENGLYRVKLTVAGRQYDSYVTKDGKLLFPQGIDLSAPVAPADPATQQPSNVPKSDKPVVELFVMSHCPYGTQAEKGILPAVRTLGDTIDFKIRFVYYAMHGELEVKEQLIQYCLQEEQSDIYLKYLACFLNSSDGGSESSSNACLTQVNADKAALESCKTDADAEFNIMKNLNDKASWLSGRFPKFDTDLALNTKYGIGGSPTLVINGVQSNAGRDSASYLNAICAAFNNAPGECSTVLSSTQPGPGFGYDSVGAANAAGCGV